MKSLFKPSPTSSPGAPLTPSASETTPNWLPELAAWLGALGAAAPCEVPSPLKAAIYQSLSTPFTQHFQRHGLPQADAQDLTHDTLHTLFEKLHTLKTPAAVLGWAWRVAKNQLTQYHRSAALRQRFTPHEEDEAITIAQDAFSLASARPHAGGMDTQLCLKQQFARFAEQHPARAAMIERVVTHGLKNQALADYLGRSLAATHEFASQSRKKLWLYLNVCLKD